VVSTPEFFETGAMVTIPTCMNFHQEFKFHVLPLPLLSYLIIERAARTALPTGRAD
jgi:hypothetical protein